MTSPIFTRTRLFYSLPYLKPKLLKYSGQKRFFISSLHRAPKSFSRSSLVHEILTQHRLHPPRKKFCLPAVCCYNCQKRWFHVSPRRQVAFPPLIWAFVKFAAKLGAILTGKGLRMWLKGQPKDVRNKYYKFLLAKLIALISISGVLGTIYYNKHQQEAPITHRKRFISLTPDQYLKVADFEAEHLTQTYEHNLLEQTSTGGLHYSQKEVYLSYPRPEYLKVTNFEAEHILEKYNEDILPATHPYYDLVVNIARQLVAANKDFPGLSSHQWTIHVIKNKERNAFVLPNGYVFVHTGLIEFCDNDDQLAMVIGHEMAHALMLHAAEQLSYTQLLDYLVILVMAAIWFVMPSDGIAVVTQWFYNKVLDLTIHMPYSRKLEKEADIVGLQLASKACYDVREGSVFWQKMNIASDIENSSIPEWASTHPTNDKRVETFDFLLPKAIEQREKNHCPALPECDPRARIQQLRLVVDNLKLAHQARGNLNRVQRIKDARTFVPHLERGLVAESSDKHTVDTESDGSNEIQVKPNNNEENQLIKESNGEDKDKQTEANLAGDYKDENNMTVNEKKISNAIAAANEIGGSIEKTDNLTVETNNFKVNTEEKTENKSKEMDKIDKEDGAIDKCKDDSKHIEDSQNV